MTPGVELLALTRLEGIGGSNIWGGCTCFDCTDPGEEGLKLIEYAGRVDYASTHKSDPAIVKRWLESGHESMVEMVDAVFLITCSRVVSHELVRHRAATSFQQESQRYVRYLDEDPDDLFYLPEEFIGNEAAEQAFREAYQFALNKYRQLVSQDVPKQLARYVLPNATRTRIVMKANLREWRHILKLRMHKSAQPEMQTVAWLIWDELNRIYPPLFEDIPKFVKEDRAPR